MYNGNIENGGLYMFKFKDKDIDIFFTYETYDEFLLNISSLTEDQKKKAIEQYNDTKEDFKQVMKRAEIKTRDKILISVLEFAEMFGMSDVKQMGLRNRMIHPIPYIQIEERGKISYKISDVMKWFDNYKKND